MLIYDIDTILKTPIVVKSLRKLKQLHEFRKEYIFMNVINDFLQSVSHDDNVNADGHCLDENDMTHIICNAVDYIDVASKNHILSYMDMNNVCKKLVHNHARGMLTSLSSKPNTSLHANNVNFTPFVYDSPFKSLKMSPAVLNTVNNQFHSSISTLATAKTLPVDTINNDNTSNHHMSFTHDDLLSNDVMDVFSKLKLTSADMPHLIMENGGISLQNWLKIYKNVFLTLDADQNHTLLHNTLPHCKLSSLEHCALNLFVTETHYIQIMFQLVFYIHVLKKHLTFVHGDLHAQNILLRPITTCSHQHRRKCFSMQNHKHTHVIENLGWVVKLCDMGLTQVNSLYVKLNQLQKHDRLYHCLVKNDKRATLPNVHTHSQQQNLHVHSHVLPTYMSLWYKIHGNHILHDKHAYQSDDQPYPSLCFDNTLLSEQSRLSNMNHRHTTNVLIKPVVTRVCAKSLSDDQTQWLYAYRTWLMDWIWVCKNASDMGDFFEYMRSYRNLDLDNFTFQSWIEQYHVHETENTNCAKNYYLFSPYIQYKRTRHYLERMRMDDCYENKSSHHGSRGTKSRNEHMVNDNTRQEASQNNIDRLENDWRLSHDHLYDICDYYTHVESHLCATNENGYVDQSWLPYFDPLIATYIHHWVIHYADYLEFKGCIQDIGFVSTHNDFFIQNYRQHRESLYVLTNPMSWHDYTSWKKQHFLDNVNNQSHTTDVLNDTYISYRHSAKHVQNLQKSHSTQSLTCVKNNRKRLRANTKNTNQQDEDSVMNGRVAKRNKVMPQKHMQDDQNQYHVSNIPEPRRSRRLVNTHVDNVAIDCNTYRNTNMKQNSISSTNNAVIDRDMSQILEIEKKIYQLMQQSCAYINQHREHCQTSCILQKSNVSHSSIGHNNVNQDNVNKDMNRCMHGCHHQPLAVIHEAEIKNFRQIFRKYIDTCGTDAWETLVIGHAIFDRYRLEKPR